MVTTEQPTQEHETPGSPPGKINRQKKPVNQKNKRLTEATQQAASSHTQGGRDEDARKTNPSEQQKDDTRRNREGQKRHQDHTTGRQHRQIPDWKARHARTTGHPSVSEGDSPTSPTDTRTQVHDVTR
ncbi:hypothetical protein FOMPIDRAFT_1020162 [Fomitopsis schrenkii]|uniref:Uncharacterized protein n=1 Tax=Fomitopsis schrenkii TaxID=2126942 RepID=S8EXJ4_FOMSC|nr:hypothetical protein FOMPIDRAFT_1020162 [Fomitopsis schrenkii]